MPLGAGLVAAVAALAFGAGAAPALDALSFVGDVPKPALFSRASLEALGPEDAVWKDHGTEHKVHGVALDKLMAAAGFEPGRMGPDVPKAEKRAGWKKALRLTAADGFQTVLSCGEVWPELGRTRALVVWQMDGKPLPAAQAPFRLVVLTDQEPSRSLYGLVKIELLDLRS